MIMITLSCLNIAHNNTAAGVWLNSSSKCASSLHTVAQATLTPSLSLRNNIVLLLVNASICIGIMRCKIMSHTAR
eukprot:scaffold294063_cov47-Prasinocladus_malaysianus.AAC.1